ncbi:MAG: glutaredoxin domain-containing protein [Bacteroidota bacterium]
MENSLKVYGTDWCPKTALLKNYLQSEWIDFDYYNVDTDEDAKQDLMNIYDGKAKFPMVINGEKHIKNPSVGDLKKFLNEDK